MAKRKTGKLRVAVIGCGGMGKGHCKSVVEKVPEMKLVAVADAFRNNADAAAEEFKVKAFYSHKDLIKSGECDAVIIATPHPVHPPVAMDCFKGGLDVICEKPLSENISTAEKMVKTAKKYKRVFAVMFQRRFEADVAKAIEIARAGKLGKIHRATLISPEYRSQAYYDSGSWRATWEFEGGGVMMNQSPHIMDIFVNLVGLPTSVRGNIDTKMHQIEVEDFAEATMKFKDGGCGYFYCSTNEPAPGQMIEIYGDKGKLLFRNGEMQFWEYKPAVSAFTKKNKEMWARPEMKEVNLKIRKKDHGHFTVMRNFARHILKGEKLLCAAETGLPSLELANAITLSSFLGTELKLPVSRSKYNELLKKLRENSTFKKKNVKGKTLTDPKL